MASWDEEKERNPYIVVCIPLKDPFVTVEWAISFNDILLPSPYHVLFRRGPLPIDKARNELVEEALKLNSRYILFWDSDVIVQKDAVYRLLSHHYPVTSILYPDKPGRACVFQFVDGTPQPVSWEQVYGRVVFADAVGFGMVLIDARVFKLMKEKGIWPPFKYEYSPTLNPDGKSEDQAFCAELKELGFSVLVDGRVVGHHVFTGKMVSDKQITHLVP